MSDSWAFGGYGNRIVPPGRVHAALGHARQAYVFSRYVYTPLAQLGMQRRYPATEWDDGELIGPVPIADFPSERRVVAGLRPSP